MTLGREECEERREERRLATAMHLVAPLTAASTKGVRLYLNPGGGFLPPIEGVRKWDDFLGCGEVRRASVGRGEVSHLRLSHDLLHHAGPTDREPFGWGEREKE